MSTLPLQSSQHLTDVTSLLECNWRVLQSQSGGRPQKPNTRVPCGILKPCSSQHYSQDGLQNPSSMDVKHAHGLTYLLVHLETILV